jgi:uncharacterized protein (TIGR00251 family)
LKSGASATRGGSCALQVHVTPGAKQDEISIDNEGRVRVRVREPASEGRANEAVLKLLSKRLGVPRSRLTLVRGAIARRKVIAVAGLETWEIVQRLGPRAP